MRFSVRHREEQGYWGGRLRLLVLALALGLVPADAPAAIFVRIDGVPGESDIEGYEKDGWFQVDSGSYGTERMLLESGEKGGSGGILNIGIGEFLPIGLSGLFGLHSAAIVQASIAGNSVRSAEIHLAEISQPSGEVFVFGKIRLTTVFIFDCDQDGDADTRPRFSFRLRYNQIEIENIIRDPSEPKGTNSYITSWDLVNNEGSYREADGSAPNAKPTISGVADKTVDEDGVFSFQVTVGDADSPVGDLTLSGSSDNSALLDDAGIKTPGDGAARTVTIRPRADRHGQARVTLTVSDGFDSVASSFNLEVTPLPDPPEIAEIDAVVTSTDETAFTIPLDASDPDQDAESLVVNVVPADPSTIPASGLVAAYDGGWELEIDPTGSQSGTTAVAVEVIDDTGRRVERSFMLTVNGSENSAPTEITITGSTVDENSPGPVAVGTLDAADPDGETEFTFGLIDSAGGKFQLAGDLLLTAPGVSFDYEEAGQHPVRLSATDGGGLTFVQALVIEVGNLNEPPSIELDLPATPDFVGTSFTVLSSQIGLADPDAGASAVRVDLSLQNGMLTIDDSASLSGKVTGNGTGNLSVEAVLFDLNLVIANGGLAYSVDPAFESDSLTVTVDDLGSSGQGAPNLVTETLGFDVRVEPIRQFLEEFFTPEELDAPQISGLLRDPDGDELSTLLEFKLGTNPRDPRDGKQDVELSEIEIGGEFFTTISYTQRTDASTPHTRLDVRVASTIAGWRPGGESLVLASRDPVAEGHERLTFRSTNPRQEKVREFYQLFVEFTGLLD